MRNVLFVTSFILLGSMSLHAQGGLSKVSVRVILVDKDLNQKPVPHITIVLVRDSSDPNSSQGGKTDFAGNVGFQAPPGKYHLATPEGVDYQGHHYAWEIEINVGAGPCSVDLSNDNARITDLAPLDTLRKEEDLTLMFQKYQKSVVTVWSEFGSGTGFIVDSAGLIMTNQHVIGPSELISIQFDAQTKVAAKVLAVDPERDVAILCADLSAFPGAIPAPLAGAHAGHDLAVEGERVFTIGSPLGLKKIITSGIVSKVEPRAIISDVNINHGNSGGPLFNSKGDVIGITTFLEPTPNGPSLSGVVRIDQAAATLERARKKMNDVPMPGARLLPVEPIDPYPLGFLKDEIKTAKLDINPYVFTLGGFNVTLETPVLKYELQKEGGLAATRERGKRTRNHSESKQNTFDPLQDMHGWEEYTKEYKPVLLVKAEAQFREKFMSKWFRGVPSSENIFGGGPARLKFKTDFYRMKLLCGAKEVEPIQSGKFLNVANEHDSSVNFRDATYDGFYSYPPDAISPSCGKVTLEIFSEKDPNKSESKDLDQKSIDRVWKDFRPYIATHGGSEN